VELFKRLSELAADRAKVIEIWKAIFPGDKWIERLSPALSRLNPRSASNAVIDGSAGSCWGYET
jgi:hypothetical protein